MGCEEPQGERTWKGYIVRQIRVGPITCTSNGGTPYFFGWAFASFATTQASGDKKVPLSSEMYGDDTKNPFFISDRSIFFHQSR